MKKLKMNLFMVAALAIGAAAISPKTDTVPFTNFSQLAGAAKK